MHHEALRVEQLPELLKHFGGKLRRNAAQVGQLLGQPLHIGFGQSAQNLLAPASSPTATSSTAALRTPERLGRLLPPCKPAFISLLSHNAVPLSIRATN